MKGWPKDPRTARELLDTTAVPGDEPWDELADRVEKVLALHSRGPGYDECGADGCRNSWPCPTVRALNGEGS